MARKALGCRDFVVSPDPIEPDRVNIYAGVGIGKGAPRPFVVVGRAAICDLSSSEARSSGISLHRPGRRSSMGGQSNEGTCAGSAFRQLRDIHGDRLLSDPGARTQAR